MIIKLQLILKMTAFCSYACSQTNAPLLNCTLDNAMVECSPLFSQSLLQMCDISYARFVHTFLHDAPDFVVNRIEIDPVIARALCYRQCLLLCTPKRQLVHFSRTPLSLKRL